MSIRETLFNLLIENPGLSVLFLVNHSFKPIEGIEMNYVMGKMDSVFVSEYCCYSFDNTYCYVLRNNIKEIQEYLYEKFSHLSLDVRNRKITEELDKIEWKKAIFVLLIKYDNKPVV